uniref:Uncharacterized protein n=1 Tax=Candidatus Kentrum sp. LPFa TaxID=2126335 RepID=A0A450WUC2_9GAMM|nr:MAG: hypothetical protein BECKLPF1236B_GA0070989_12182 [Candidatus Kentron sp. LPFa]
MALLSQISRLIGILSCKGLIIISIPNDIMESDYYPLFAISFTPLPICSVMVATRALTAFIAAMYS